MFDPGQSPSESTVYPPSQSIGIAYSNMGCALEKRPFDQPGRNSSVYDQPLSFDRDGVIPGHQLQGIISHISPNFPPHSSVAPPLDDVDDYDKGSCSRRCCAPSPTSGIVSPSHPQQLNITIQSLREQPTRDKSAKSRKLIPSRTSTMDSGKLPSGPTRYFLAPRPVKAVTGFVNFDAAQGNHVDSREQRQFISGRLSPRGASLPSPAPSDEILFPWSPRPPTSAGLRKPNVHSARGSPKLAYAENANLRSLLTSPPPSPTRTKFSEKSYEAKRQPKVLVEDDEPSIVKQIPGRASITHPASIQGDLSNRVIMTPPPFSGSPDLDKFVISSAAKYSSSDVQAVTNRLKGTSVQAEKFCNALFNVLRDLRKYKKFLEFRGADAQRVLDDIQMILDDPSLEEQFRSILLIALIRLSRKSELYPRCFDLTDVTREGEYPVADGHYCEIRQGRFNSQLICLKLVKTYTASDRELYRKAFFSEAVIWGQMSHPNVLPFYGIYKLGDTRNRFALISPWLPNGSISDFLRKNPDVNRGDLVAGVAAGMSYLHRNQVVHGDIKGANILITDSGRACLTDFGLSSLAEAHGVQYPAFSSGGTARFQAPELIDPNFEHPRSKASDVYAFAMTCYQIYTGHIPFFEVKRDYNVLLKVGRGERPEKPLDMLCQTLGLTNALWALIQDCWEQAPNKRPNASHILERLFKIIGHATQMQEGWGDLCPPRLREPERGTRRDNDSGSSSEETIRLLQSTGLFVC